MDIIKPQVELAFNPRFLALQLLDAQNQPMVKVSGLWQEIQAALDDQGKTQTWLANELGLSDNAVTKWKKTGQISRDNAIRVSALLGIPLDRLLAGRPNPMVEVMHALPDENRQQTFDFILYQLERAKDSFIGKKTPDYVKMIEGMRKDMDKRKGES